MFDLKYHPHTTLFAVVVYACWCTAGCGSEASQLEPIDDPVTQALVVTAEEELERGSFNRALMLADSAARRAPGAVEPLFLKGLIYSRTLRWEEAEAAYRQVLERDPEFVGAWNNMGNNALWQGEYDRALSYYYSEIEIEPAARPWGSIGRIYREMGVVDSAKIAFEKAIALDSSYVPAYLSYAQLLEDEGEYERALALVEKAAARDSAAAEVRYMKGSLLARVGRDREAALYLEDVTEAWPWHTESHYKLGRILQRLGRTEESRQALAKSEDLWKKQADISAYQKSLATDQDNPYAHAALATAFRMAGRYDEAVRTYKVALSLDPQNLEFQNNLASLHFLRHDTVAAIRTYENILEQDPEMVEVWINLGVLYALSGSEEKARWAWSNALARRPNDPQITAYLARLDSAP